MSDIVWSKRYGNLADVKRIAKSFKKYAKLGFFLEVNELSAKEKNEIVQKIQKLDREWYKADLTKKGFADDGIRPVLTNGFDKAFTSAYTLTAKGKNDAMFEIKIMGQAGLKFNTKGEISAN